MKRWHLFLGGSVLIAQSLATACGTSSENDYGGAGGTGTSATQATATGQTNATNATNATTNTATATNTGTSTPTATTTGGGDPCSELPTYGECVACYCDANEPGCLSYFEFEDESCLCGPGSDCEAQCSNNYCMGENFEGSTCETCYNGLTGEETCFETAYNNCMADATCSAYLAGESAACDALPE